MFSKLRKEHFTILFAIIVIACFFYMHWLTISKCYNNDNKKNNNVVHLDNNTPNSKASFTLYYTTWCGHSKMFQPVWKEFMEHVNKNLSNKVEVKSVNCEENEESCKTEKIYGYPTCILYVNNERIMYNGPRTVKGLLDFVNENIK